MPRSTAAVILAASVALMGSQDASAFVSPNSSKCRPSMSLAAEQMNRRDAMLGIAAFGTLLMGGPQPAEAKYSEYARREKDWEERKASGEIKVSSARDLKRQLAEIAPQNNEGSRIFCPNGPSSSVSPLMENKCGDRMATASVYGRTNDSMGNSVPGFKDGYAWGPNQGTTISAATGGFPTYKENEFKIRDYGK